MRIICTLLICWATTWSVLHAQTYRQRIYQAYVHGNMQEWWQVIDEVEQARPASINAQLELVNYYYGYIGYLIGAKQKKEAEGYVEKGERLLALLERKAPNMPEVYAYQSSYIGFRIGLAPYKAPFIGGKSAELASKAMALDSMSVQANITQANIYYYTPTAFGGDKAMALRRNQKALELLEADSAAIKENWEYLGLLTRMGQQAEEQKDYKRAKALYEKSLQVEPRYQYVKKELLPALLVKMR